MLFLATFSKVVRTTILKLCDGEGNCCEVTNYPLFNRIISGCRLSLMGPLICLVGEATLHSRTKP